MTCGMHIGFQNTYKILCRKCEGRRLVVDIGEAIILKWILKLEQDSLYYNQLVQLCICLSYVDTLKH